MLFLAACNTSRLEKENRERINSLQGGSDFSFKAKKAQMEN